MLVISATAAIWFLPPQVDHDGDREALEKTLETAEILLPGEILRRDDRHQRAREHPGANLLDLLGGVFGKDRRVVGDARRQQVLPKRGLPDAVLPRHGEPRVEKALLAQSLFGGMQHQLDAAGPRLLHADVQEQLLHGSAASSAFEEIETSRPHLSKKSLKFFRYLSYEASKL